MSDEGDNDYLMWMAIILIIGGTAWMVMNPHQPETPLANPLTAGVLEVRITDAPTDDIQSLMLTISGIKVHYEGGAEQAAGWLTVQDQEMTYDLMRLRGTSALLGEVQMPPGAYSQVRLLTTKAQFTDSTGTVYELQIPSQELKLVSGFQVETGKKLTMTLDFDAKNSLNLHESGQGSVLRPTVKVLYANVNCVSNGDCPGYDATLTCGNLVKCEQNQCQTYSLDCPVTTTTLMTVTTTTLEEETTTTTLL